MKKFSKHFALLLALALVFTSIIPTVNAEAATMSLSKTTIRLYLGSDTTTNLKSTYTLSVKNKNSAYKVTYKSSKTSVATVGASTGKITAKGVGTATITATVKNGTTTVKTLKATVKVYRHAAEIGVRSALAKVLKNGIEVGTVKSYHVGFRRATANGAVIWGTGTTKVTDKLRFKSSDTSVFTVGSTTGKITAKGEGTAVLTVYAVDYTGKNKVQSLSEKVYPVVVVAKKTATATPTPTPVATATPTPTAAAGKIVSATQEGLSDLSVVKLTFATEDDAKAVIADKSLLKVERTKDNVTSTIQSNLYASITAVNGDAKSVYLKLYENAEEGTKFTYSYNGSSTSFKGVGNKVAGIAVGTTTVTAGEMKDIPYTLYNANGVDVTKVAVAGVDYQTITFSAADSVNYYKSGNQIYFTKGGVNAVVTAKVVVGYDSMGNEIAYTSAGPIAATETTSIASGFTYAIGAVGAVPSTQTYSASGVSIPVDSSTKQLFIKYTKTTGKDTETLYVPGAETYTFTSSDSNTLAVSDTGIVYPVKTGSVKVIVKNSTGSAIAVIPVTVTNKSILTSVALSANNAKISLASAADADVDITALDQYGNDTTLNSISYEVVQGSGADVSVAIDADYSGFTVMPNGTYEGKSFTGTKTIIIRFTFEKDGVTRTSNFVLTLKSATSSTATNYVLSSTNTRLFIDLTKAVTGTSVISLEGKDSEGFVVDTGSTLNLASSMATVSTGKGVYSVIITDPSGNPVTTGVSGSGTSEITFNALMTSGGTIKKAAAGTYIVKAYVGTGGAYKLAAPSLAIVVYDGDALALTLNSDVTSISDYSNLKAYYTAKRGSTDVTENIVSITPVSPTVVGKSVVIQDVVVKENTAAGLLETTVKIQRTFTLK